MTPPDDNRRLYVRVLGEVLGPLTWPELLEMAGRGTISGDDAVRREGESIWVPARLVPGLLEPAPPAKSAAPSAPTTPAGPPGDVASAKAPALAQRTRARRAALVVLAILPTVVLVVAAAGWYWQRQSLRFPVPAHLRRQAAAGRYLLGMGPLSDVEYVIVLLDVVLVAGACAFFVWRALRRPRTGGSGAA